MAQGGQTTEARLIAQLSEIFPHYAERVIRDSVYSVLVATNGANVPDAALIDRCIDGLLIAAEFGEMNVPPAPVQAGTSGIAQGTAQAAEPMNISEDSSLLERSANDTMDDAAAAGPTLQANDAAVQSGIRRQNDMLMITEMFPWVKEEWVVEQLALPGGNREQIIERLITTPKDIPKKEKPKPKVAAEEKPAEACAAASTATVATSGPKDYLDYSDLQQDAQYVSSCWTHYISSHFPWLYMDSIRALLKKFNSHGAPAFKALQLATKDIDFKTAHLTSVPVTISKPGEPIVQIHVRIMRNRRPSRRLSIVPQVEQEIQWIEKHLLNRGVVTEDSTPTVDTAATTSGEHPGTSIQLVHVPNEDSALERARETGDLFECSICFDEFIISTQMIACADGHLFCIGCLRSYAQEAIYGQTKTDLFCMNDDCDARFLRDMVVKALDESNVKKLDEKRMYEALNVAEVEGLEKCKYCDYAVVFDVPPEVDKVFKCAGINCGREYCRICQVEWDEHIGKPCKEVENADDTRRRRDAEEKMAEAVIRRCHKCKAPMIKEEGCNKLRCSCGGIMCYICKAAIQGYEHFCQHVRNPGQSCTVCTRCSLWEDPKKKDNEAVDAIQAEAKQAVAETGKLLKIGVEDPARNQPRQPVVAAQRPNQPAAGIIIRGVGPNPVANQRIEGVVNAVAGDRQGIQAIYNDIRAAADAIDQLNNVQRHRPQPNPAPAPAPQVFYPPAQGPQPIRRQGNGGARLTIVAHGGARPRNEANPGMPLPQGAAPVRRQPVYVRGPVPFPPPLAIPPPPPIPAPHNSPPIRPYGDALNYRPPPPGYLNAGNAGAQQMMQMYPNWFQDANQQQQQFFPRGPFY